MSKLPNPNLSDLTRFYGDLRDIVIPGYSHRADSPTNGFARYTGNLGELGTDQIYNTPLAARQLAFALAFSGHHFVTRGVSEKRIYVDDWVRERVLQGMKILDLGCGPKPTFARAARYLGADVFTVDVPWLENFEGELPAELKQAETDNHIAVDLNRRNSLEEILRRSKGGFDLVTQAHVDTSDPYKNGIAFWGSDKLAKVLLTPDGLYFDAFLQYPQSISPTPERDPIFRIDFRLVK